MIHSRDNPPDLVFADVYGSHSVTASATAPNNGCSVTCSSLGSIQTQFIIASFGGYTVDLTGSIHLATGTGGTGGVRMDLQLGPEPAAVVASAPVVLATLLRRRRSRVIPG